MKTRQVVFTISILAFLGVILYLTSELRREQSQVVPMWVVLVTLVLGLGVLASDLSVRIAALFKVSLLQIRVGCEEEYIPRWSERKGGLFVGLWITALVSIFWLFGFYISTAIAITLFVKVYGKKSWVVALVVVACSLGLIYMGFDALIGLRMFRGVVFGDMV